MAESAHVSTSGRTLASDLVELGKPRVTLMVSLTAALGEFLAPGTLDAAAAVAFLAGTALLVASANTLNCWIERESDGRMLRTRNRALPSGRMDSAVALAAGIAEGAVALGSLALSTNLLVALLGAFAHLSYVLVYTPMKRWSPLSLPVGAVPGAIPPLMGWAACAGSLGAPAWELFGILFLWQIPHFAAIALYLEPDYRRGGLRVLSVAGGGGAARRHLVAGAAAVVAVSFVAAPLGMAGTAYVTAAAVLGAGFLLLAARGLRAGSGGAWARATFRYSIAYLAGLVAFLVLDAR